LGILAPYIGGITPSTTHFLGFGEPGVMGFFPRIFNWRVGEKGRFYFMGGIWKVNGIMLDLISRREYCRWTR